MWILLIIAVSALSVAAMLMLRGGAGATGGHRPVGQSADSKRRDLFADVDRLAMTYELDDLHISRNDGSAVGINFRRKIMIIGSRSRTREFGFSNIVAVEVISDGVSISKTNRGSQLMGAAIGGLLLGGAGAVVGAVTGSKTNLSRIGKVSLRVSVDDPDEPLWIVTYFDPGKKGVDANSAIGRAAAKLAERWNAHLTNAMKSATAQNDAAEALDRDLSSERYGIEIIEESADTYMAMSALDRFIKPMDAARLIKGTFPSTFANGLSRKDACRAKARLEAGGFRSRMFAEPLVEELG